jgi:hypothetical protein
MISEDYVNIKDIHDINGINGISNRTLFFYLIFYC